MQDNVQSELLLAFSAHGLVAHARGSTVIVPDAGLELDSRVIALPSAGGNALVRVDVVTYSPRLGTSSIVESFAGMGDAPKEAIGVAFMKFLLGVFHVLMEALADHSCSEDQGEWSDWSSAQASWRVCSGPVVSQSGPDGEELPAQCGSFFNALEPLYSRKATAGPHWMRVFVSVFQGELQAVEVLFDNETWTEAEDLAWSWTWAAPQSYASARVFAVALPVAHIE